MESRALLLVLVIATCGFFFGACGRNVLGNKPEEVNITLTMDNVFDSMAGNMKFAVRLPSATIRTKVTNASLLAQAPNFYVIIEKVIMSNGNLTRVWVTTVYMKSDLPSGLAYGSAQVQEEEGTKLFIRGYYYESNEKEAIPSNELVVEYASNKVYKVTLDFTQGPSSQFIFEAKLPTPVAYSDTVRVGGGSSGGGGGGGKDITVRSTEKQPANSLAPAGARDLLFTGFVVQTSKIRPGHFGGVTVERTGLGSNDVIKNVVLLNDRGDRMTKEVTLTPEGQAFFGFDTQIPENSSLTFYVAASIADDVSGHSGEVVGFKVIEVYSEIHALGDLPIIGATHTINDVLQLGKLRIEKTGIPHSISAGMSNQMIGAFQFNVENTYVNCSDVTIRIRSSFVGQAEVTNVMFVGLGDIVVAGPNDVTLDGGVGEITFTNALNLGEGKYDITIYGKVSQPFVGSTLWVTTKPTNWKVKDYYGYTITPSPNTEISGPAIEVH